MTVATPNQVNLRVRIAEVQVSKLNEIGVNWSKIGSNLSLHDQQPDDDRRASSPTRSLSGTLPGQAPSPCIDALDAGGVHHEPGRAEPDRDVRPDRELSRRRRSFRCRSPAPPRPPGASRRSRSNSRLRRQARLHPDDHRCQPSQPERPTRGQRADDCRRGVGAHHRHPGRHDPRADRAHVPRPRSNSAAAKASPSPGC